MGLEGFLLLNLTLDVTPDVQAARQNLLLEVVFDGGELLARRIVPLSIKGDVGQLDPLSRHFHFGNQHIVHDLEVRLCIGWREIVQAPPVPRMHRLPLGLVLFGHSHLHIHAAFIWPTRDVVFAIAERGLVCAFAGRRVTSFLNADNPEVLIVVTVVAREGSFDRKSLVLGPNC